MQNEPIYVTKPFLPPIEEFIDGVRDIWKSHILTNYGPKSLLLQERLACYLDIANLSLFVNGHQALETAIRALDLSGEIITTPYSFASTTHAIVRSGLKPVFCDIRRDNFNINESLIEENINEHTSAIVAVHVYGIPCDVAGIERIARKHGLKIIYDAAHAFGVTIEGRGIASFGDISMFSFHATKTFNTIEGGALAFADSNLARKIYLLQNFGIENAEEVLLPGTNAKMNEFQALMGLVNLTHIDEQIARRGKAVSLYRELLSDIPGIELQSEVGPEVRQAYTYFPVLVSKKASINRDELALFMNNNGVFPRKYFYPLISEFACYRDKYISDTPIAKDIASRVLCLPLWSEMETDQICRVCNLIRKGMQYS